MVTKKKKGSIAPLTPLPIKPKQRKEPYGPWSTRVCLGLGLTQVVLGILLIIVQTTLIAKHAFLGLPGVGIGCGIFYLVTGAFGIAGSKRPINCLIITMMVLCILSAVSTMLLFSQGSIGILVDDHGYLDRHRDREHADESWYWEDDELCLYEDDVIYPSPPSRNSSQVEPVEELHSSQRICAMADAVTYCNKYGLLRFVLSLHGMMLGFALMELIVAVVASCLACRAVCGCCYQQESEYHYVVPVSVMEKHSTGSPMASPVDMGTHQDLYPISIPLDLTPRMARRHSNPVSNPPSYSSIPREFNRDAWTTKVDPATGIPPKA